MTDILKQNKDTANVGILVNICKVVGAMLLVGHKVVERGWEDTNVFIDALVNDAEAMQTMEILAHHGTKEIDDNFHAHVESQLPTNFFDQWQY